MKRTITQILPLIILLTFVSATAVAQDNKTEENKEAPKTEAPKATSYKVTGTTVEEPSLTFEEPYFQRKPLWSVGLQGGLTTGMGIGVRFHPKGRFCGQLVFGGYKTGDDWVSSFGLEAQFDFDTKGKSRFYGILGAGYYYTGKNGENTLEGPERIGLGAGYEWDLSTSLFLGGSILLTYHSDGTFIPLPQIGMFYYFE